MHEGESGRFLARTVSSVDAGRGILDLSTSFPPVPFVAAS